MSCLSELFGMNVRLWYVRTAPVHDTFKYLILVALTAVFMGHVPQYIIHSHNHVVDYRSLRILFILELFLPHTEPVKSLDTWENVSKLLTDTVH